MGFLSKATYIVWAVLFEQEILSYVPPLEEHRVAERRKRQVPPTALPAAPAVVADFEAKLRCLRRQLEASGCGQGPQRLKLQVRRSHLLTDAYRRVMAASVKDLRRCRLSVQWTGEEALDHGGPAREFFCLLSRELFDPRYGLYECEPSAECAVHVSPLSVYADDCEAWFRFSGRVLGLALLHQHLLDVRLVISVYKTLLRLPLGLRDLAALDPQFCVSLCWLRDNNIDSGSDLGLNFSVTECLLDSAVVERELKPGGRHLRVTEANKWEYLRLMLHWRLQRGVTKQLSALVCGFEEVIDAALLAEASFNASDLAQMLTGTADTKAAKLDVSDWRRHTDYRGGYNDGSTVIVWFWQAVERFTHQQRLLLLQFVTGSTCLPQKGFSALSRRRFCIERWDCAGVVTTPLPRAHTCFNRLELPPYDNAETLYAKLQLAVEETNTFGIV